ncbi:MAG: peptide deformylase [Candidatus Dojkabacteria bacterium]|jgi:peptide deformylase
MSKPLRILTIDNKKDEEVLRTPSKDVALEEIGSTDFEVFLEKLLLTAKLSEEPAGGIAAPQVGVNKNIFFLLNYDTNEWEVFINPEVESVGFVKTSIEESCLSVPNVEAEVQRYKNIRIKYLDRDGKKYTRKYKDLNAVTIQHEKDHLDGILFIDRI